jgi:hypothetical protein
MRAANWPALRKVAKSRDSNFHRRSADPLACSRTHEPERVALLNYFVDETEPD